VLDVVCVLLEDTDDVALADAVFELVDVPVIVIVLGPVSVNLRDELLDTETVDVLLGADDLVFVFVRKGVRDTEDVVEVVLDVFAVAEVVDVKVDVLEPAAERVPLDETVEVFDEVTVPVPVEVLIILFEPFADAEEDAEPDGDFDDDNDFVFVGVPEAVLESGADLL
jgi:hypothetical protein